MPTQRPRIQVTLDDETSDLLNRLAQKKHVSISFTAAELIRKALETDEDIYLSKLSNERISEDDGQHFSHQEAWS